MWWHCEPRTEAANHILHARPYYLKFHLPQSSTCQVVEYARSSARDLGHTGNDQVHLLSSQELRLPPETIKRAQAMSISLVFIFEEDHGHL